MIFREKSTRCWSYSHQVDLTKAYFNTKTDIYLRTRKYRNVHSIDQVTSLQS